jgi:hypothetical protein
MKNIPLDTVCNLLEDAKRVRDGFQNLLDQASKLKISLEMDEYTERYAGWLKIARVLNLIHQGKIVCVDGADLTVMRQEIVREIAVRRHKTSSSRKKMRYNGGAFLINAHQKAEAHRDSMLKMQRFFEEYFKENLFV